MLVLSTVTKKEKGMTGRIVFASAGRSGDFLKWAWSHREAMTSTQRQGLAQAIYASLLGHIEATMYEVLTNEYYSVINRLSHLMDDQTNELLDAWSMALAVFEDKKAKLETMTFEPLFQELDLVFSSRFQNGPKRHRGGLEAVRNLRNVFVHGRPVSLPLASETGGRIDTDGSKLKQAIDRLVTAGIVTQADTIANSEHMGSDENRLFKILHSDAALLHFVGIGRAFQSELYRMVSYPPLLSNMNTFPDLKMNE